jgi:hypothetical protein
MRSALVRFAQPEPARAAALLELVRRLDTVLGHVTRLLEQEERTALPLLEVALELDDLADVLARWADGYPGDPPAAAVDAACTVVRTRLDDLGVPEETGPPPGRGRGQGV